MFLTSEQWLGQAAQARSAAEHHPLQAGELAAYAEECDLAAVLTVIGHFPVVEPPPRLLHCSDEKPVLRLIEGDAAGRCVSPGAGYRPPVLRLVK